VDVTLRPMRADDIDAAYDVQVAAFAAHDRRMGEVVVPDTPEPEEPLTQRRPSTSTSTRFEAR